MTVPGPTLTLTEAAEHLGVHYMTAYKYVRSGRLRADKVGREWQITRADLAAFERQQQRPSTRGTRRAAYPVELQDRLLHADEAGAWDLVDRAMAGGMGPDEVLLALVGPAMTAVGDDWAAGRITVAQEHQASSTAMRLIGRLGPRFSHRGRKRGQIIIGAVPLDDHGLPSAIVRDLLRDRRFGVTDLGANVPAESWADSVREAAEGSPALVGIGMCATTSGNDAAIAAAISAVRAVSDVPIVLGGHGVDSADRARALGADRYSASVAEAVELLSGAGGVSAD